MALPSKYIRSPNISHHCHCHHPGQATVLSPLDGRHGLLTLLLASTCAPPLNPCAPPVTGVTPCHSLAQSVATPSHFVLNKSPWFSKAVSPLAPCSLASSPALSFPTPSAPATPASLQLLKYARHVPTTGPLHCCSNPCVEGSADVCLANLNFLHICSNVISVSPPRSAYLKL